MEALLELNSNFLESIYYWFLDNFASSYTRRILIEALLLLGKLWPYLILGIIGTTLVKLFISKQKLATFFEKKRGHISIYAGAFLGVISPLGSYVIIPLSAALYATGIPLPALMALMVSSPLINPNLFIITAGAMGIEMALLRLLSAFLLGVCSGYLTLLMIKKDLIKNGTVLRYDSNLVMNIGPEDERKRTYSLFLKDLYKMSLYISKYFFLAILLAAVIKIFANPNLVIKLFGKSTFLSVLISTGAGVPFYVCGGAAIPVVQQLADLGMSKGAVLAFFISGPVTKISNLIVVSTVFKRIIFLLYLLVGIGGAVIFGLLYNLF